MPELQFKGKEFVYNHHLTVPFRPLEMHADKGIGDARLDGNLIVHGDNLHALKALLPMYAGKVDCIFIDPPYNTGNEGWAYNDNVNSPMIREWLTENPIGVEDGLRHDKWCAMIWPRLKLLYELLAEDGSFWITLDDNEFHNGRALLTEIFGEIGFVATIVWQARYSVSNDASVSNSHNYLLVFSKAPETWKALRNELPRTDKQARQYGNPDNDPRGAWRAIPWDAPNVRENLSYAIKTPKGSIKYPPKGRCWSRTEDQWLSLVDQGLAYFGKNGDGSPSFKRYLEDAGTVVPSTWWPHESAGHTDEASKELAAIGLDVEFATPKPKRLLERIIQIATRPDSLVLDSFAGSGTTAHAILAANARDNGNRRFILVEMEDYADKLTSERVRRAIQGYSFTGTQREELLREPLTFSKLRNANTLLEKVQGIETLDGPKFDRINKTVKDGSLIVTGERDVSEVTSGLGGTFTYCTLGEPIEMDAILSGAALPDTAAMAGLLWHTATATPLPPDAMTDAPEIGEGIAKLGTFAGRTYWLFYRPDLDWLKSAESALSLTKARAIAATAPGNHLVFAPAKFVSRELLTRERIDVDYAPLPFALYRLETA